MTAEQPERPVRPDPQPVTVWHDGACPLCRREIAVMRGLDRGGAIRFVDVRKSDDMSPAERSSRLNRFHAEENGRLLTGAAAFAAMWRAIPVLRPFGFAARNTVTLSVLEFAYRCFLRVRPALQRLAYRLEAKRWK